VPTKFLENSSFVIRVDAQNLFNHNNVGVQDTNIFDMNVPGTPGDSFLSKEGFRFDDNRQIRLWGKFTF